MRIRQLVRKLIWGYRCDSQSYIRHLRSIGCRIGNRVTFFESNKIYVDETRPYLIEIGDDVQITRGVTLLTHGYDWSVLKGKYFKVLGSAGSIIIGNNVFIGQNSMILKGVKIGNNVIIGANSLVNKCVPDNCVCAGNPLRIICSIEDYYKKRIDKQLVEAKDIFLNYKKSFGSIPNESVFDEFFWLFQRRNDAIPECFQNKMNLVGTYSESIELFNSEEPLFDGFDAFIEYLEKDNSVEV